MEFLVTWRSFYSSTPVLCIGHVVLKPFQKWRVFLGEQRALSAAVEECWQRDMSRTCDFAEVPFTPTYPSYQYRLCPRRQGFCEGQFVTSTRHWGPHKCWAIYQKYLHNHDCIVAEKRVKMNEWDYISHHKRPIEIQRDPFCSRWQEQES